MTGKVPPELLDGDHPVWRDSAAYQAWLDEYGHSRKPVKDRIVNLAEWLNDNGHSAHPANRRNLAAEEWTERHGVALDPRFDHRRADWHALRRLGLID